VLQQLSIKNIALIQQLSLEFDEGFHVFTGETGAGKSILIDAINFILGERVSRDIIKTGEARASVEAAFFIGENDAVSARLETLGVEYDPDDVLILSRELTASGKNTCRINGCMVNLAGLKSVGDLLVDIHGQHEHQSLLNVSRHITFLDAFNIDTITPLKLQVADIYSKFSAVEKQLNCGFPSEQERLRRLDMLAYQINEIDAAKLIDGEEEQLLAQRRLLSNAQAILSALEDSYNSIVNDEPGALIQADRSVKALEPIRDMSEDYSGIYSRLQEAYYILEDASFILRDVKNSFEFQPDLLEQVESRLDQIHILKRKYGSSIADILSLRDKLSEEQDALLQNDQLREQLEAEKAQLLALYIHAEQELSGRRKDTAAALDAAITEQLHSLGMQSAKFHTEITSASDRRPQKNGLDQVEFLLSANAGEPLKPLSKVASGGELSRIMLAIKTIFADVDGVPTIIFDEIDTGISGRIAVVVGEKIKYISASRQVLCVTHLPQIAAMAQAHYFVEKIEEGGKTFTNVRMLNMEERCNELARIMGAGQADVRALEHARELLLHGQACVL